MARRTSNKIEPAVMTIPLVDNFPAGGLTTKYVDLAQICSLVNRRFYRQGLNMAVAGIKLCIGNNPSGVPPVADQPEGIVYVSKLPNTWVMSNAWEKGMRAWLRMTREALAETESVRPKFMDYKIYANEGHYDAGFANNWLPSGYTPGEWEPSKMVIPFGPASPGNTLEAVIKAVGPNYNGAGDPVVGLIAGYANSRALPAENSPSTPGDADDADGSTPENWLAATFNSGTDQVSEVIEDNLLENDTAPYPYAADGASVTLYPGGESQSPNLELHDVAFITGTTLGGTVRIKGGNFPCGLIEIGYLNMSDTQSANVTVLIDLVPGDHRGYLAEPMTEM
jgi:hypothetical protein